MSRLITKLMSRARSMRRSSKCLGFVHGIPQFSRLYWEHGDEQTDNKTDEQSEAEEIS